MIPLTTMPAIDSGRLALMHFQRPAS